MIYRADDEQEMQVPPITEDQIPNSFSFTPQEKKELIKEAQKEAMKEVIKEKMTAHPDIQQEQQIAKAEKESLQKNESQKVAVRNILIKAQHPLFKATAVFPFDFFPDDIIVDFNKVTIVHRPFIFSEEVHSIAIEDIIDVLVETNILFGTVKIIDRGVSDNKIEIKFLWRKDAFKARRMVQGLLSTVREHVDLTHINATDLPRVIEEIGSVKYPN